MLAMFSIFHVPGGAGRVVEPGVIGKLARSWPSSSTSSIFSFV